MAQIVIRKLDEDVKAKLQRRAKRHGHSTEEEVRQILTNAVRSEDAPSAPLGSCAARRFAGIGLDAPIEELRGGAVKAPELDA